MEVDFDAVAKGMAVAVPYIAHIGIEVTEMSEGAATAVLPDRPDMTPEQMREIGLNVLRIYHSPPRWFLDGCAAAHMRVLITLPWEKHIEFLRQRAARTKIEYNATESLPFASACAGIMPEHDCIRSPREARLWCVWSPLSAHEHGLASGCL